MSEDIRMTKSSLFASERYFTSQNGAGGGCKCTFNFRILNEKVCPESLISNVPMESELDLRISVSNLNNHSTSGRLVVAFDISDFDLIDSVSFVVFRNAFEKIGKIIV